MSKKKNNATADKIVGAVLVVIGITQLIRGIAITQTLNQLIYINNLRPHHPFIDPTILTASSVVAAALNVALIIIGIALFSGKIFSLFNKENH